MLAPLDHDVILPIAGSFILAFILTAGVRRLAMHWGILDKPEQDQARKIHTQPTPLLGGIAIFVAIGSVVGLVLWLAPAMLRGIPVKALAGLALGGFALIVGGVIDDRRPQPVGRQIIWPIIAALIVIVCGVGVRFISNPLGGVIWLDRVQWTIFAWHGTAYHVTPWADLFALVWILGMIETTKLLDGLDGLVSGVTAIGGLIVAMVSLRPEVDQPGTALLALLLSASCLGFLPWNWHPARIFLGESGAMVTGFLLGSLAILSGGKIATALLIMGLPILDVVWVMLRRAIVERRSPFRTADRKHLHFRLLDIGLTQRQSVLFLYGVTAVFGSATLFVHGRVKLLVLALLVLLMVMLGVFLALRARLQEKH